MKKYTKLSKDCTIFYEMDDMHDGFIYIEEISVNDDKRGQGIFRRELTNFIDWVGQYTDANGITLLANPLDDETDYDRLVAFYETFGFIDDGYGFMMLDFRC